jgi:diguanylate cyclase (GGDEF)-like protein
VAALVFWLVGLTSDAITFDSVTRDREQELVRNGLRARIAEIAHEAVPQIVWDDAVRHLDNRFDRDWAHNNIGQFFSQTDGLEVALVFDHIDHLVYSMHDGADIGATAAQPFVAAALTEIAPNVRLLERARNARASNLLAPIQSTSIERIGDRIFILTATLVQPDFGAAHIRKSRAPIVVTGEEVNETFLQVLAQRYMLDAAHMHFGDQREDRAEAHASLVDLDGSIAATIDWLPKTPGATMLHQTLPLSLLAFTCFSACALFFYFRHRAARRALKASEARATHAAYHDPLTGLPNRALLLERLAFISADIRSGARPCALVCIDLARFKSINDHYGYHVSDELIGSVRERLLALCDVDDTLARIGGDEFAMLHFETAASDALGIAQRALDVLNEVFDLSVGPVHVRPRAGVFAITDGQLDGAECLRRAEVALYHSRSQPLGAPVQFSENMDAALRSRNELERELQAALDAGQLTMCYQPQVDRHSRLVGVEALVRWDHPQRGSISPTQFVPMAEECGLIERLGEFTIRQAFADSSGWPSLKVAINVSAVQLRATGFPDRIAMFVKEFGVDTRRFEFEITEGVLLGEDEITLKTLLALREMGFSIALDDFGTGYSNLSYLQRYPIDKIKIDRSFVSTIEANADAKVVIAAIVKLAKSLRMRVIAEGVETEEQRQRLADVGCWETQGFLTGKPQPASDLRALVEREHAPAA